MGKAVGGVFGGSGDAEMQNQRAIAAIGQPNSTVQTNVSAPIAYTTTPVNTVNSSTNTLDQFMQLWLQATPDEREKMRQWAEK